MSFWQYVVLSKLFKDPGAYALKICFFLIKQVAHSFNTPKYGYHLGLPFYGFFTRVNFINSIVAIAKKKERRGD